MELKTRSAEPLQQPAVVEDSVKETKEECIQSFGLLFF